MSHGLHCQDIQKLYNELRALTDDKAVSSGAFDEPMEKAVKLMDDFDNYAPLANQMINRHKAAQESWGGPLDDLGLGGEGCRPHLFVDGITLDNSL